jgi:hypothetical protein
MTILRRKGSSDSSVLSMGTRYATTSEPRILLVKFSDSRSFRNSLSLTPPYSNQLLLLAHRHISAAVPDSPACLPRQHIAVYPWSFR